MPALVWLGLLTYGSLYPSDGLQTSLFDLVPYGDKAVHFVAYAGLVVLVLFGIGSMNKWRGKVLLVIVAVILWSLMMEYLQRHMGLGRSFEVLDIIANIIGSLVGGAAFVFLFKRRYYGN